MRVTWPSLFSNMAEIDYAPRLNAVSRDKKSASVRQADVPTNFNPIWPRQKKPAVLRQKSASVRKPLLLRFALFLTAIGSCYLTVPTGFDFVYRHSSYIHCLFVQNKWTAYLSRLIKFTLTYKFSTRFDLTTWLRLFTSCFRMSVWCLVGVKVILESAYKNSDMTHI